MSDQSLACRPPELRAWDEAFRRVESYLQAHGIQSRVQLNLLVTEIIGAAQKNTLENPGVEPVTLAMRVTEERIAAWFGQIFGPVNSGDDRLLAQGRLAMIMADLPSRWPQHFLSPDPVPEELSTALTLGGVRSGPEVRFTNMAPRPIELAPTRVSGYTAQGFARGPLLRAAAMWVMILGVLGVTWAASH